MDDLNSDSSSIENQISGTISMEQNNDDIQDLTNFPRDSFVDHTPYNISNTNQKYLSSPFQNKNPISKKISHLNNDNTGYSSSGRINVLNNNYNNKYNSDHFINQPNISQPGKYAYTIPRPEVEPIPQDTIVEEEVKEEEINTNVIPIKKEIIVNDKNQKNKKYDLKKLYEICRKNGTPPPDGDFSLEGWKLFYPPNEKFFLWEKGKTIPNQVMVANESDEENIEIYEGEINPDNERHGFGILTTPKFVKKGTWRDGEFTGWGRESRINGDIFEGKFIDSKIYGKGINKSHKGNLYVGDFLDNKREGKGELKTKNIHYEGDFKYDKFNGKGKLQFLKEGHSYEGEFKDNEINGMGIFKWNNGDVYEGEMTNGKMNGYGKYIYSNGQIYEGNYVNGVKEGLGKLIYPNKKIYEGEFKGGKPQGEGTITVDGKKVNIIYKNGRFQKKNF